MFGLASATSFLLYLHRYTWGFVKVAVAEEFDWRDDTLGWLDSAFMISYAGGQIPEECLATGSGRKWSWGSMILVWSLSMGGMGLAGGFRAMAAVRMFFGLAQAGCYANLSKVTKVWFPISERTAVAGMGLFLLRTDGRAPRLSSCLVR